MECQTARAKELLEDAIDDAVLGYRAASFSIVRDTLWPLDQLIDLGFRASPSRDRAPSPAR